MKRAGLFAVTLFLAAVEVADAQPRRPGATPTASAAAADRGVVRGLLGSQVVKAIDETPALIVKRAPTKQTQLLRWDLSANVARPLYQSSKDTLQDVGVAPNERFVAVIETKDGVVNEEGEYSTPPVNQLVILDARGRPALTITQDVQIYKFSPDGKQIAFVTGGYYEGGVGFTPGEAWIVDLTDPQKKRTRVPDIDSPFDIDWLDTEQDRLLYVRTLHGSGASRVDRPDRVHRFSTKQLRTTASDDPDAFDFSPDGRFYLVPGAAEAEAGRCKKAKIIDCTRVVERSTRRPVVVALRGRSVGWAYGRGALLMSEDSGASGAKTQVFDVSARRVLESFDGAVVRRADVTEWQGSEGTLIVRARAAPAAPSSTPAIISVRRLPSAALLRTMVVTPGSTMRAVPPAARRIYQTRMSTQPGVDRAGRDYRSVWLESAAPGLCEALCLKDPRCKAYTYVKPGVQGPQARCYLKDAVPSPSRNSCCLSGVKED